MDIADDGLSSLRVQSASFPERDRIEAMREAVCRHILNVVVDPLRETLEFDLTLYGLPDLGVGVGDMSPARCTRASAVMQNDDVILTCVLRGGLTLLERGREAVAGVGEAVFVSNDVPGAAIGYTRSCAVSWLHTSTTWRRCSWMRPPMRLT